MKKSAINTLKKKFLERYPETGNKSLKEARKEAEREMKEFQDSLDEAEKKADQLSQAIYGVNAKIIGQKCKCSIVHNWHCEYYTERS